MSGYWPRFARLVARYKATVRGAFFGHIHTDQWSVMRECRDVEPVGAYIETTGIKWCSGGGDFSPGDAFGAGTDGLCPLLPADWSIDEKGVPACEAVCTKEASCVGFTLEFTPKGVECCFRTGSTSSKPVDPTSKNRCYEKPPMERCDGEPTALMLPGPSLTEGFPATNPSVRLLEFDPDTFALVDAKTFMADLHAANAKGGALEWKLEFSFRAFFSMADLSPSSFDALSSKLAVDNSPLWSHYRGKGNGGLYCTSYTSKSAPFAPTNPCEPCEGSCKSAFIALLNGTNLVG